jgi:hypothetical protein
MKWSSRPCCVHLARGIAWTAVLAILTIGLVVPAQAQTTAPPPAATSIAAPDPCRLEVSKFEQVIGFLRQNQGNQAAAELKEKLLPAKLESEILFKDGYCGLAKYLREKKLIK